MALPSVTAIVLAAGASIRMGSPTPKVLLRIAGRTILERSVAAFVDCEAVSSLVVVAHPDIEPEITAALDGTGKPLVVVPGGPTRSTSSQAGLDAVAGHVDFVLVHDAARPLVTVEMVGALASRLTDHGASAATVAVRAGDTMLTVHANTVVDIPDRSLLWHAQTPQGFRTVTLRAAYAAAGDRPDFTDDCGIVRRYLPEVEIGVVEGSSENLKITRSADLAIAESILAARRRPD